MTEKLLNFTVFSKDVLLFTFLMFIVNMCFTDMYR